MEVELFIHGVPKGQDFWGIKEDQAYFSNFYAGNKDDEVRFLVETRKSSHKNYCYYTYLKYKDVVDVDGRAGSYIGVSLRFDTYCKDVVTMFRILETTYNKYVVNTLLQENGNKTKYTVASFAEKNNEIRSIQSSALKLIEFSLSGSDFVVIDDSFINQPSGIPECNILDCTKENILIALKKYSRVAISPSYPTNKETTIQKNSESRLVALASSKSQELEAISTDLSAAKNQINSLKQQFEQQKTEIERLRSGYKRQEEELRQNAIKKNVDQIITSIKDPIQDLTSSINQLVPGSSITKASESPNSEPKTRSKNIRLLFPLINMCLLIFVIALQAISLRGDHGQKELLIRQVDTLRVEKQELKYQLDSCKTKKESKTGSEPTTTDNAIKENN